MPTFNSSTDSNPEAEKGFFGGRRLEGKSGLYSIAAENPLRSGDRNPSELHYPGLLLIKSSNGSWLTPNHRLSGRLSSLRLPSQGSSEAQSQFSQGWATMGCNSVLRIDKKVNPPLDPQIHSNPVTFAETVRSGNRIKNQPNSSAMSRTRRLFPAADVLWDRIPA